MRSQSGTEKHIAANGISARSKAIAEGFVTVLSPYAKTLEHLMRCVIILVYACRAGN